MRAKQDDRGYREAHDQELEVVAEEAHNTLNKAELRAALRRADQRGHRAGWGALGFWLIFLGLGSIVLAAIVGHQRFAVLLPLLLLVYAAPLLITTFITVKREGEAKSLLASLEEREFQHSHDHLQEGVRP